MAGAPAQACDRTNRPTHGWDSIIDTEATGPTSRRAYESALQAAIGRMDLEGSPRQVPLTIVQYSPTMFRKFLAE